MSARRRVRENIDDFVQMGEIVGDTTRIEMLSKVVADAH